jgi:hypothetical protein
MNEGAGGGRQPLLDRLPEQAGSRVGHGPQRGRLAGCLAMMVVRGLGCVRAKLSPRMCTVCMKLVFTGPHDLAPMPFSVRQVHAQVAPLLGSSWLGCPVRQDLGARLWLTWLTWAHVSG